LVAISLTPLASGAVKRTKRHASTSTIKDTARIPIATADIRPTSEGTAVPIAAPIVLTTSEIMDRARMQPSFPEPEAEKIEMPYPDRSPLPQNPNSPDAPGTGVEISGARPGSALPDTGPFTAQTTGVNFLGPALVGTLRPPDTMGAVGPTQFIATTNNRFISYNKSTGAADGVLDVTPDSFFGSVRASSSTSDPRVRYDRLSGRWFIVIINVALPNRILMAWSDANSGGIISNSTVWSFTYFVNAACATCLADYPTLGIDANALYIGANNFSSSDGGVTFSFFGSDGYVVPKAALLGGSGTFSRFVVVANASSAGPYTPQGVDNYDPSSNEGYFIGVDNLTFGTLMLRRVSSPGTSPAISANISIVVSTTSYPKSVPHLGNTGGTNGNLDALDDRLFAAHIRNGRLWTAHNITVTTTGVSTPSSTAAGRVGVRWYELTGIRSSDNGGTPATVQFGTFYDSTSDVTQARFFWIPSVVVTGQGHAAMGFSTAGSPFAVDAGYVGRWVGDSTGSMQTFGLYTSTSSAYNPSFDPGGTGGRRWGDYSLTSVDPIDDMTAWTVQEYCNATNSYAARVVKLLPPGPATLASASPASIASGQTAVSVTITGTATSGRGFFDPGSNLAAPALPFAHISAQVTGGVVVNSVTYSSPTSVTLSLKTTGVSAGAVTVTITNPDGQSTSSSSILSVTNSGNPAITCPATVSVNTPLVTGSCGMNVTFSGSTAATATGTPTPTISYSPTSGSFFPVGTTSVTATATNTNGSASCSFNVVVADKTGPVISCPSNMNVTTSGSSAIVTFSVTATDNCGSVTVVSSPPSGSSFPLGTTTVVSTATDSAGNTANCSFNVTVTNTSAGAKFWLVTPCRLIDTRNAAGPLGGPSLNAGVVRNVAVIGNCGVPSGAVALALNLTAVVPGSSGWMTLYPGPISTPLPYVSTINYRSGKVLANNAVVPIGSDGTINAYNSGPSPTNFIIDVTGYFK
jgi:hypothetical protein